MVERNDQSDPAGSENVPPPPDDQKHSSHPLGYQARSAESTPDDIWNAPQQLGYQAHGRERLPPIEHPFLKFFTGAVLGIVLVVIGGFAAGSANSPGVVFICVSIEFVAGIVITIMSRESRPFGIGLILAVPIGVMIFMVGCFLIIAANR